MTADRPTLGILLMLGFCIMAPLGDGMAKWIGTDVPLLQLVAVRFGVQFLLLLPLAWTGGGLTLDGRGYWLTALRTILHILGIGLMFLSLRYLPLADAVAIAFVMPFIMLLLGWLILNEEVGPRRLVACGIGFCGTLLVTQPSFVEVGWPALLPMAVALVFALFMLVTRLVARRADPISLQTISGGMALVILLPPLIWMDGSGIADLDPIWPDGQMTWILLALGVLGTVAHLFMTWSLRFAPAATLAPMQYLEIPVAALIGWLIFAEFPDGLAVLGIGIVMSAGLYIIWREHALQSQRAVDPAAG
ncbi:DMT family transporter [Actibacterium sp. 188UL27-1]|uniref:DMT family transporter n=1 Tax=Actibacterium sp. 188UL27-1 TaxID=2786961 RepID=UPI001959BEB8|nr:DMT family transporter [Actibacterium sp. 188UL27-1]MBM7069845.1 DMT family transporter [Actibacterium sp. 188UL27-1]